MHDGDHDILDGQEAHGHHEHDHDHDHEHPRDHDKKKKQGQLVKIIAGVISIGLIVGFVLWKIM